MINTLFIPYKQALELKELGFDEICFGYWRNEPDLINPITIGKLIYIDDIDDEINYPKFKCLAPMYQQVFKWFREKHNLNGEIYTVNMGCIEYTYLVRDLYSENIIYDNFIANTGGYSGTYNKYEEVELACLKKLIEIVKNK